MRVYRALLRLFPAAFRERFGVDMADVFADRLGHARVRGARAVVALWVRTTLDLTSHGLAERRAARARAGRIPRRTLMPSSLGQDLR